MRRQNRNNLWVRRALLALLVCGVGAPAPLRADDKALQRWEQMPAEERERALKNYETWKSLDAGEREKIRERWERFRALPPERQAIDTPDAAVQLMQEFPSLIRRPVLETTSGQVLVGFDPALYASLHATA